ncbi:MAG: carbon starvation protein A [Muribaculaceae bacterium]
MITFIASVLCLIAGYMIYGAFVERVFGADAKRPTPCHTQADGVDYIEMPTWRIYLIQFLNIAGTGPIFGAIQGVLFGPSAFIWIVIGCIFGGAVHDYISGMISLRCNGASLPEIIGNELGSTARIVMRFITIILLILVGTTFTLAPAGLLANLTDGSQLLSSPTTWIVIILLYYIFATLLPINKLIGKVYPLFGLALMIMAVALFWGIFTQPGSIPEITEAFVNHHPNQSLPILPCVCITIACGAVSGFHATQSPMMARCIKNERHGRPVFFGAMITEGLIALIWAAAAIKFADSFDISKIALAPDFAADITKPYGRLWAVMTNGGFSGPNPAIIVNAICNSWLGTFGAVLVILGVVAAPITTGDTAFRSARLISADMAHFKQDKVWRRVVISLPLFIVSVVLMFVNFDVLWRYFFWFNQDLAIFTLFAVSVWLAKHRKNDIIAFIPALWMTWVCVSYILLAREGFGLSPLIANIIGIASVVAIAVWYLIKRPALRAQGKLQD